MALGDASNNPAPDARPDRPQPFSRRVLIAVGITVGVVLLALFLYFALYVLLLAFAGVLLAVLLRGAAEWLAARTGLNVNWSLAAVIVAVAGALLLLGWLVAPGLSRRVNALATKVPQSLERLQQQVNARFPWVRQLMSDGAPPAAEQGPAAVPAHPAEAVAAVAPEVAAGAAGFPSAPASQPSSQPTSQPARSARGGAMAALTGGDALGTATRLVQRVIGAIVALVVVLVVGVYLAAQPKMYVRGLLHLMPYRLRPRAGEIFAEVGHVLRWWMIGQLIPMTVIGIVTALGLKAIGVEMWLTLGLLAALFNFIPNFGPLISFIPAVLFALTDDPGKVPWVVALYVFAQSLEGYVLSPLVQRKAVELPPALLILGQVLMGTLAGGLGLVLAAPLTAAVVVVVKMAYVREALDDPVKVPSEHEAEKKEGAEGEPQAAR